MPDDERKPEPGEHPAFDFVEMFDLQRTTLTGSMVDRMEACLRQAEAASDDLKAVVAECRTQEYRSTDIAAMKKIARLRLKDRIADAREQLAALQRVSRAVQIKLFD